MSCGGRPTHETAIVSRANHTSVLLLQKEKNTILNITGIFHVLQAPIAPHLVGKYMKASRFYHRDSIHHIKYILRIIISTCGQEASHVTP